MMMMTKRKMKVRMRRTTTTRKWMIIWNKATKGKKKRSKTNRWTNEKIQSISEGFMFGFSRMVTKLILKENRSFNLMTHIFNRRNKKLNLNLS